MKYLARVCRVENPGNIRSANTSRPPDAQFVQRAGLRKLAECMLDPLTVFVGKVHPSQLATARHPVSLLALCAQVPKDIAFGHDPLSWRPVLHECRSQRTTELTLAKQEPAVAQKVAQKLAPEKTIAHKKIQPPLSDWIF